MRQIYVITLCTAQQTLEIPVFIFYSCDKHLENIYLHYVLATCNRKIVIPLQ